MDTTIVGMLVLSEISCIMGLVLAFGHFVRTLVAEYRELNREAEEVESLAIYVEGWKNTGVVD